MTTTAEGPPLPHTEDAARLIAILLASQEGIVTISSEGVIEQANPALDAMFGFPPGALVGQPISVLMPESVAVHHDSYLNDYGTTGVQRFLGGTREVLGQRQDGSAIDLEVLVTPLPVEGERKFTGILRDVSERRSTLRLLAERTEELERASLREAGRAGLLRDLADHVPAMAGYWNRDLICKFANRAYLDWFAKPAHEVIGQSMSHLLGPVQYERNRLYITAALRGEEQLFQDVLISRSGEPRHLLVSYVPNKTDGGFFATATDVTTLKRTQTALEAINTTLRRERVEAQAAQALFEGLFRQLPEAVLLLDAGGIVQRANEAALKLFRIEADAAPGCVFSDLVPTGFGCPGVTTGVRADGSEVPVEVHIAELWIEDSPRILATVRDLSELVRRNEALGRSNAELQQFAYVASHDLQEPLRKVASFVEILEEDYGPQLDDQAREYIGFAADGARRMRQLIEDLLSVSRVREDQMQIEDCDTRVVVRDVQEALAAAIHEANATIQVGDLPRLMADPSHLRQVFHNLLTNALKYRSEAPLVVTITARPDGGMWHFSVRDNGIGFKQEYATRIFTIFQRLVSRSQYEGTGIGLAIVSKVVTNHGGRIWATSEPGAGTEIEFTMPGDPSQTPAPALAPQAWLPVLTSRSSG
jgi:PAS domain S-box-containing protein